MRNERIFVSGGAGVIGQVLVGRLVGLGASVLVGDLKPRPKSMSRHIQYRQGDLNTISFTELSSFAPTMFFHLAATFERSVESFDFFEQNFLNNIRLSHHLLSLLKDVESLKRVVFASSYLIYDSSLYTFKEPVDKAVPLSESMAISPRNLTGMAKLAHEVELGFLERFRSSQFSSVSARIFRGYGRNSRDVISRWIRSTLRGEEIRVFCPEGIFDYIYADDTAEGLIRIAQTPSVRGIVNLGTGRPRRVADIVNVIRANLPSVKVVHDIEVEFDYEGSCADINLLMEKVHWTPKYDLEEAIPEIIEYERTRILENDDLLQKNILISSASRKVPLVRAVVEASDRLGLSGLVLAGDVNSQAQAQYACNGLVQLPETVEENLDKLTSVVDEHQIGLIIPTRDGELDFWSKHRAMFKARGVDVLVSEREAIAACVDKLAFAEFGASHDLPTIPAWESPRGIGPFVVKERFGSGSRSIGIKLGREAALAHGATLTTPIYQPFVDGREVSVDAWLDRRHKVKGLVLRDRDEVANGESVVTTTFRNESLEATCREILEALPLRGPVVLQLILDENDKPHVIELNARFGGASTASIAVGLDIWGWSILEHLQQDLISVPFLRSGREVRQIRVPEDLLFYDPDI